MNVYKLTPEFGWTNAVGMALVAAHTYEQAKYEYMQHGSYAEEVATGNINFTKSSDIAIVGLHAEGNEPRIICDSIHFV